MTMEIIIMYDRRGRPKVFSPLGPLRVTILDANIPHLNGVIPEDGDRLVDGEVFNVERIEAKINAAQIKHILSDITYLIDICADCGEPARIIEMKDGLCFSCNEKEE